MRARLTKRACDAAQPKRLPDGRAVEGYLWDDQIPGFGMKTTRDGAKSFIFQYREGNKMKRLTIGRLANGEGKGWEPELARREALSLRAALKKGDDPAGLAEPKRDVTKATGGMTVGELCDRYIAEAHVQKQDKKPGSWQMDALNIEAHIRPKLGATPVADLTRAKVEQFQHEIATCTGTFAGRGHGGRGIAVRSLAVLSGIFSWAMELNYVAFNPAHGVKRLKLKKRQRVLTTEEIGRLTAVLDAEEASGANPYAVAVVKLLMLTGARRGEILGLRWSEIDFENRIARLPDSKTAKDLRLGKPSIAILKALPRLVSCLCYPRQGWSVGLCGAPGALGSRPAHGRAGGPAPA